MAVYEAARPRSSLLPRREPGPEAQPLPRRRMRGAVRANRRASRTSLILGGIVVAFLLAFFSLAQDVRVSATTYDIDRLQAERAQLLSQEQEIRSDLERLGQEPAIRKLSIDAGLTQLGEPLVLPGR
jgi:predicted exporter